MKSPLQALCEDAGLVPGSARISLAKHVKKIIDDYDRTGQLPATFGSGARVSSLVRGRGKKGVTDDIEEADEIVMKLRELLIKQEDYLAEYLYAKPKSMEIEHQGRVNMDVAHEVRIRFVGNE